MSTTLLAVLIRLQEIRCSMTLDGLTHFKKSGFTWNPFFFYQAELPNLFWVWGNFEIPLMQRHLFYMCLFS